MTFVPRAQEIYKHFKGRLYQIVTVAEHTETGEIMVVYQAMYGEFKVYVRPLSMFCSKVDKEKYPDVKQEYRFALQESWSGTFAAGSGEDACVRTEMEAVQHEMSEEDNMQRTTAEAVWDCTEEMSNVAESIGYVTEQESQEELQLDPMLLAFLDAENYAEKLSFLTGMYHRITDDMITTMAIASDIEIEEGDLENRYMQLKNCLQTLERYEITRLR